MGWDGGGVTVLGNAVLVEVMIIIPVICVVLLLVQHTTATILQCFIQFTDSVLLSLELHSILKKLLLFLRFGKMMKVMVVGDPAIFALILKSHRI